MRNSRERAKSSYCSYYATQIKLFLEKEYALLGVQFSVPICRKGSTSCGDGSAEKENCKSGFC